MGGVEGHVHAVDWGEAVEVAVVCGLCGACYAVDGECEG